jgi:DNA polymerase-3 subunit epsilon
MRSGDPVEVEKYLALLAECVEDGRLTFDEAQSLTLQARRTRLTGTQLRDIHRQAWDATFPDEKSIDWTDLSPVRRREMYLLADALGLSDLAAEITAVIKACAEPQPAAEARFLRGLRVGIVGDADEIVALRKRAESYGAKLAVSITRTVVWMATTTPDSTDAKHNSARNLGIPMLTSAQASDRLDEAIREAELKAYERQREN